MSFSPKNGHIIAIIFNNFKKLPLERFIGARSAVTPTIEIDINNSCQEISCSWNEVVLAIAICAKVLEGMLRYQKTEDLLAALIKKA